MNLLDSLMSDRILLAEWMLAAAAQTVPRHHNTVAVTQQLSSASVWSRGNPPRIQSWIILRLQFQFLWRWWHDPDRGKCSSHFFCRLLLLSQNLSQLCSQQFLFYRKFFFLGDCPNLLKYDISFLFTKMNLIHLMMSFSTRIKNIYLVVATLFRQLYFQNKCKDRTGPS